VLVRENGSETTKKIHLEPEKIDVFVLTYIEGLGQKYEFAFFYQRCLPGRGCPVAMCKITYLKSLGLSNFCEIWHR
jgi:hypothetical protein